MDEVTLFITSCGRPHLLKETLITFINFNTYNIKEAIIMEDSGQIGIIDFVKDILIFPCKIIYNEKRIGQMRSIERGVNLIQTDYVFHCEDDWQFYKHGFIEKSLEILKSNSNISQVLLRNYSEYINMYKMKIMNSNTIYRRIVTLDGLDIYSFNPSLKSTKIQLLNIPYADWDDEYTIQSKIRELKLFAVVTDDVNGYVSHIGWNEHINESNDIKYRNQFSGK